jgi:hypothetical protein
METRTLPKSSLTHRASASNPPLGCPFESFCAGARPCANPAGCQHVRCYCAEELDATMVEINYHRHRRWRCRGVDAKMTFDDNAPFRHPTIAELATNHKRMHAKPALMIAAFLGYFSATLVSECRICHGHYGQIVFAGGEPANSRHRRRRHTGARPRPPDIRQKRRSSPHIWGINRCDRRPKA